MPRKQKSPTSSSKSQRKTTSRKRNQTDAGSEQSRGPDRTPIVKSQSSIVSSSKNDVSTASTSDNKVSAVSKDMNEVRTAPKSEKSISTSSSDENQEQESTFPGSENKRGTIFYRRVHEVSKRGRKYLIQRLPLIIPSLILMLLGFKEIPQKIPLLDIAKKYPVGTPIIGGALAFVCLAGLIISFMPEPNNNSSTPKHSKDWRNWWWMSATAMLATSFLLSSTLLVVALVRPVWCPSALCLPPQLIPITYSKGIHDSNLEVYFTTFQTTSYVLSRNPTSYTLKDLPVSNRPESIGAQRIDEKTFSPYRVVLGVHSLQQGRYGLIIEEIALLVRQVPLTPSPLNVWVNSPRQDYHSNPYLVIYNGQAVGTMLAAVYMPIPHAHVQLAPGEADELDVQVVSETIANLQFQVQVTYRVSNESQLRTLILPNVFEVVFSDLYNWHPYHLQDGHFVVKV
jgi:hypothetical protein